jgi:hypothetical protein
LHGLLTELLKQLKTFKNLKKMGRYYNGDIEGKFWFAVQSSNSADRFGVTGNEPAYLDYWFDEDNLEDVEIEIKNIEKSLGNKIKIIEDFFKENDSYNDEKLKKADITEDELSEYADLELGIKIRDHIKDFGQCSFQAEC